jgi:hypothetical protein
MPEKRPNSIEELAASPQKEFLSIDKRFDGLDQRVDRLEHKIDVSRHSPISLT